MKTFMPIVGLALLGLAAAVQFPGSEMIHDLMTSDEVKQVFNTLPHAVPEYNVVPILWPRIHKRSYGSATKLRLNAFGRDINLWLNPTEGVLVGEDTPVYVARSNPGARGQVSFSIVNKAMGVVGELLEDQQKQASLLVKRSADGRTTISGHIASEGWVVKPLPQRFDQHLRNRRSIFDNAFDFMNSTVGDYVPGFHVIFKNPKVPDMADYITMPLPGDILNNKASRAKRSAPSVIYPQVLVFVDYETYRLHGEDLWQLLEYMVPFWNGVDLRYRGLEFPKVRLNVAGVVIAQDANAFSFINHNKVSAETMNIFGALDEFGKYMRVIEPYFPLDSYDVAVAMAPYEMCAPTDQGTCRPGTLGLAYLGGACNYYNAREPKTLAVSVIQDKGGFDGMHTAAHELGHLFGSGHDGQGDSLCSAEKGHIMASTPVLTENSADWSPCTLEAFDKFFNVKSPKCLFNKPKSTSPLPRILPGSLMTMDEQCAKIEGTRACRLEENMCMRLRCIYKKDDRYCTDVGDAAADGTPCATGKICLHGQCRSKRDLY